MSYFSQNWQHKGGKITSKLGVMGVFTFIAYIFKVFHIYSRTCIKWQLNLSMKKGHKRPVADQSRFDLM